MDNQNNSQNFNNYHHDSNLQSHLDLLKEKLNSKEKEIAEILNYQKEEYERTLKQRDEDVSLFLDGIIKENLNLKKTIVMLEIEIENMKQQLSEKYSDYSDNKIFYENLRLIKDKQEIKSKELMEKYERENKNIQKENKKILNNLKKLAYDTKNKLINEEDPAVNENKNGYIPLSIVEENFLVFENKLRILNEELNNKEKYAIVLEQKYEMVVEENKMIKNKIQEEKIMLLKKIDLCEEENNLHNNILLEKINSEVFEKKTNLEKEFRHSLEKSEKIILELMKEKNRISEELKLNNDFLISARNQITFAKKEKEEFQKNFESSLERIKEAETLKNQANSEITRFKIEKESWERRLEDLNKKLNDNTVKIFSLEIENKSHKDNFNIEAEKIELKYKNTIEVLNNEVQNLNSQIKDLKSKIEDERQNGKILLKMKKEISELQIQLETSETELNKKETNSKVLQNNISDLKFQMEKLNIKYLTLDEESNEKNLEIKSLKEKLAELEIESFTLKKEYNRILTIKDDLFNNYEESKKNNVNLNNQFETLKITSNVEIQRLKNQMSESEKKNNSAELGAEYKSSILRLYNTYLSKLSLFTHTSNSVESQDITKIINELEKGYDLLISKVSEKNSRNSVSPDPKLVQKYEEEIKELRKKLNTVMQITSTINKPNTGNNMTHKESLKIAENENSDALYESIYIYLKNQNLKQLLQIFGLNIQKEEEIKALLNDKNYNKDVKKQISDLSKEFISLKKLCETYLQEYQQRAKMYIQPEEVDKKLDEYKLFTQSLLDMVLDTLMNYKSELADAVVFKLSISDYNAFIENISVNLENFNKKINLQLENYNNGSISVDKALESLIKNTTVDYELLNSIMNERII